MAREEREVPGTLDGSLEAELLSAAQEILNTP